MAMTHVLLNNRVNSTRCQYELVLGFCLTVPSFLGNRAEGEHLVGRYNDRRARASLLPALLSRNSSKLQDANRIESRKHYSQHRFFIIESCVSQHHGRNVSGRNNALKRRTL